VTGWKTWMEIGFNLYNELERLGCRRVKDSYENINKGAIEVFPRACFTTLAGYKLSKKSTEEGLNERISVLSKCGFKGLDRRVTGSKHVKYYKLDALAATYTGFLTFKRKVSFLGDAKEGEIVVPVKELKDSYKYISKVEKLNNNSIQEVHKEAKLL
jgi:hypothetical protein